jgi:outer membrane receptor protein involved in Fe transport
VAYTYRGKFYVDTEGNSQDDRIQQPFGTLDANISYSVGENLSFLVEATNILQDSDVVRFVPIDLPAFYTDNGRRVLFGVRATF